MKKGGDSKNIAVLKNLMCHVIDIYEVDLEASLFWLLEPLPVLNGLRPIDCTKDQEKNRQLQGVLRKLESGEFP